MFPTEKRYFEELGIAVEHSIQVSSRKLMSFIINQVNQKKAINWAKKSNIRHHHEGCPP